nr:MAG TPA: hypothetical protein [Caudoviricetes sp.]
MSILFVYIKSAVASHCALILFKFLFQPVKFLGVKELSDSDVQTIADFLYRSNSGVLTFSVENAFYSRLRNAGNV